MHTQVTASELLMLGTEVGLLIWVPTETTLYNIDTPSDDIKGKNIRYHSPEKIVMSSLAEDRGGEQPHSCCGSFPLPVPTVSKFTLNKTLCKKE